MPWTVAQEQLVRQWESYARIRGVLHQRTASWYDWGHYTVGPCTIILTSISAITQFSQPECQGDWNSQATAAVVLTLLGSVMAGLQTFFRFDRTSTQHRATAAKYEGIQRDIEETLAYDANDRPNPLTFIPEIKKQLNALIALNLSIPRSLTRQYVRDVDVILDQVPASVDKKCIITIDTPALASPAPAPQPPRQDSVTDDSGDYQDEFAEAVRQQLAERQEKIEMYQLSRLNTVASLDK